MSRSRHWYNHPFIVVPPFVFIMALIWQQHTLSGRSLNLPVQNANLLAVTDSTLIPQSGLSAGWQLAQTGDTNAHAAHIAGYISDNATRVTVDNYKNGNINLISPKVSVQPNQAYLFKGYYTSDIPVTFLAHYFYNDGTDTLINEATYPSQKDYWSTASHAFRSGGNITAVQFIFKLARAGSASIDGFYLEQRQNIYIPPDYPTGSNLIPNSELAIAGSNVPDHWTMYRAGDNHTAFTTAYDNHRPYVQTQVTDFKSGEAKWEYEPQPASAYGRYYFRAAYRSNTNVKAVAEYTLDNGARQFITLADLPPADQWTEVNYDIELPIRSTSLNVSFVLQRNGILATRNYSLINITKPGTTAWKRPLVSITFDDGWRSTYLNAIPMLDRYRYKATFYINPSSIETPGFMYADDLNAVSRQHEIASHGYSHKDMTTISNDAVDNELRQGKDYLTSAGYTVANFAPPYGKSDAEVEWVTRKYFTTSRSTDEGINTRQNIDAYNLKTLYLEFTTPREIVAQMLNETTAANGWLILVYHNVGSATHSSFPSEEPRTSTVTTETFANHLAQIQKSGITVLPVNAAYAEISKQ